MPLELWPGVLYILRATTGRGSDLNVHDIASVVKDQRLVSVGEIWVLTAFLIVGCLSLVVVGAALSRDPSAEIKAKQNRTAFWLTCLAIVYWGFYPFSAMLYVMN